MIRKSKPLMGAIGVSALFVSGALATAGSSGTALSADEAQARLRELMRDPAVRAYLPGTTEMVSGEPGEAVDVLYTYPGSDGEGGRGVIGPDVIVGDLHQFQSYGVSNGIAAFSVGTVSCNIGDVWLNWFQNTNQHPVIGQNLHRYSVVDGAGRFEQIGQSWLKHGFFALSEGLCFSDCQPTNGTHLGVHCSDPYTASLNGQQSNLGPRSQVNASTGFYPYPWSAPAAPPTIGRRMQVHTSDLTTADANGEIYFAEGQYVAPDDTAAGNDNNNASYRRVEVHFISGLWSLGAISGHATRRELSAVYAWQEVDPQVTIAHADVPELGGIEDGRFTLGSRATDLGNGMWRYEFALQNLNSHASGGSFSVAVPECANVTNVGFHDVDSHSGEPYALTDWASDVSGGTVTWSTQPYATNANANALRWGTLYNFRFDADVPPTTGVATIGLFRPWTPDSVNVLGSVPSTADCGCEADVNGDGELTVADFTAFREAYLAGDVETADFDNDGKLSVSDFTAFRNAYLAGCP